MVGFAPGAATGAGADEGSGILKTYKGGLYIYMQDDPSLARVNFVFLFAYFSFYLAWLGSRCPMQQQLLRPYFGFLWRTCAVLGPIGAIVGPSWTMPGHCEGVLGPSSHIFWIFWVTNQRSMPSLTSGFYFLVVLELFWCHLQPS